ncbi:3,4-dihydroxy-2-butanone-4-phosphate synthase [Candidatus Nitrososphaera sp. FF02]|uniref:3,4-dihydroxy-2-butanone-4-phosphate synthase n=1 Tax=Candidatus Nitrososphaera sp. FF02 TaxID=3398226 RepID=UPI0039EC6264
MTLTQAIEALKAGRFVMVHDDKGRENEIDLVVAAEHITPAHVATMRQDAGGLLCLAIANEITARLGLVYMHDMIAGMGKVNPVYSRLTEGRAAYGDKPSFSIYVNHRNTYTGITDSDRALTISEMAKICKNVNVEEFAKNFHAPGHVPILIAAKNLLAERNGHTELCVYLMKLAGMTPAVAICEMMDSQTHKALSIEKASAYAKRSGIPLVEASELKEAHQRARVA